MWLYIKTCAIWKLVYKSLQKYDEVRKGICGKLLSSIDGPVKSAVIRKIESMPEVDPSTEQYAAVVGRAAYKRYGKGGQTETVQDVGEAKV